MSSALPTPSRTPSRMSAQSSFTAATAGGPEPVLPAVPERITAGDQVEDAESKPDNQPVSPKPSILPGHASSSDNRLEGRGRLERAQGAVRRALSEGAAEREPETKRRIFEPLILGGKSIEVLLSEQDTYIHPLLKAVMEAQHDIENVYREVPDNGSWDGRWSLPSQSTWECFEEAK